MAFGNGLRAKTLQDLLDSGAQAVRKGSAFTNWETIYKCPFCESIRGTPDKRGHLYWNERKRRGVCFRCGTSVVYGKKLTLEEICQDHLRFNQDAEQVSLDQLDSWDVESWSAPAYECAPGAEYLAGRGVSREVAELYNLRYTDVPYPAIVLPNGRGSSVNFFQLRRMTLERESDLRYINPPGTKPVYGMFLPPRATAVISEGPFSAIGAYNPSIMSLGLYGKSMSVLQHHILTEHLSSVEHYILCLDGGEGYAMMRALDHLLDTGRRVSAIFLPHGKDPSDLFVGFENRVARAIPVNKAKMALIGKKLKFGRQQTQLLSPQEWNVMHKLFIDPGLDLRFEERQENKNGDQRRQGTGNRKS